MSSRSPEINFKSQISNLKLLLALAALSALSACGSARPQAQTAAQTHELQTQAAATQPKFERPAGVLRVCADPNNLPFSNERGEGFENKVVEAVAEELGARVEYTWWAQRRGFFRNTLRAGLCDLVAGVPGNFEMAQATSPYYRSSYVFVYRKDKGIDVRSFDDPALRTLKIGVQMIGDDFANTPPAHALTNRHIVGNVRGYMVYGDYSKPGPASNIIDAVVRGEVDVAVAWGPLAGYYARRHRMVPLAVVPVSPQIDLPFLPFVYDISMGVRRGDNAFREEVEGALARRRVEIERILDWYGVPRVPAAGAAGDVSAGAAPPDAKGGGV